MTRPRLTFVLSSLAMGGAEAQLATVLEADRDAWRGYDLTVLTLTPERHPIVAERFARLGVAVALIDRTSRSFPSFLAALVRELRRQQPHLVHAFLAGTPSTWGRAAAILAGVPAVMLSDLSLDPPVSRVQTLLDPWLHRRTHAFLPNAQAIAERLIAAGAARERVHVVRNGVDLERFDPDHAVSLRPAWGVPAGEVVVGFLGMLRPEKRADLFVDALLAIPPDARPAAAVIAGDGPQAATLRERIAQDAWARDHVRMLGVVGDVPGFLAGIDVLVLPSDTEGLPNAVLEAMAMGVPVVATAVSDVPFLVGSAGEVVPPRDATALAAAVRRLVAASSEERARLGAIGRDRAQREFGIAAAARAFWTAHRALLEPAA